MPEMGAVEDTGGPPGDGIAAIAGRGFVLESEVATVVAALRGGRDEAQIVAKIRRTLDNAARDAAEVLDGEALLSPAEVAYLHRRFPARALRSSQYAPRSPVRRSRDAPDATRVIQARTAALIGNLPLQEAVALLVAKGYVLPSEKAALDEYFGNQGDDALYRSLDSLQIARSGVSSVGDLSITKEEWRAGNLEFLEAGMEAEGGSTRNGPSVSTNRTDRRMVRARISQRRLSARHSRLLFAGSGALLILLAVFLRIATVSSNTAAPAYPASGTGASPSARSVPSGTSVTLSWNAIGNASYQVFWATSRAERLAAVVLAFRAHERDVVWRPNERLYTFTFHRLLGRQFVYWRVRALKSSWNTPRFVRVSIGHGNHPSTQGLFLVRRPSIRAPVIIGPRGGLRIYPGVARLRWRPVLGARGYLVSVNHHRRILVRNRTFLVLRPRLGSIIWSVRARVRGVGTYPGRSSPRAYFAVVPRPTPTPLPTATPTPRPAILVRATLAPASTRFVPTPVPPVTSPGYQNSVPVQAQPPRSDQSSVPNPPAPPPKQPRPSSPVVSGQGTAKSSNGPEAPISPPQTAPTPQP